MGGLRINTNTAAIAAQRHIAKNDRVLQNSLEALATGTRVKSPQDDAAGFAISERLRGQLSGVDASIRNTENAQALLQTAEGSLNEQNNILVRMRELAINAASDTVGDEEREFLDTEFQQLKQEFDRIAQTARFGSKQLLTGTGEEFQFQVGPYKGDENVIKFTLTADTTASEVGVDSIDINNQDDALDSLEVIDEGVTKVAQTRAGLGAYLSRFDFTIDNLSVQKENLAEAKGLITDVDVAHEVSRLTQAKILEEAGALVMAQANQSPMQALKLLQRI